ncbi:MAG: hypothetical protein WCZ89_09125 [Phycisphaerae bacterium]
MEEEQVKSTQEKLQIEQQLKSGASWFYWIAGLSIINSILVISRSDLTFIIGLGITQIISGIGLVLEERIGSLGHIIAFVFCLIASGVFAMFGIFANKRHLWAFIVGMVLYALDGLLFLIVQDWLSIGFHVFALVCIYSGLKAQNKLAQMQENPVQMAEEPEFSTVD